jgi:hypothetical protein
MSCDWLYFLLLASNVAWVILCFLLDAREWKKRALRAEEQLSQNRKNHSVMLGQLDEILQGLKRVKLGTHPPQSKPSQEGQTRAKGA